MAVSKASANGHRVPLIEAEQLQLCADGVFEPKFPNMNAEMARPVTSTKSLDLCATGLSFLCLLHCVALPFLVALIPAAASLAEAEWVHKMLVLMAAPVSLLVLGKSSAENGRTVFAVVALTGISLLFAAAFVEPLEAQEQWVTMLGALLVGGAHLNHWVRQNQLQAARQRPAQA